VGDNSHVKDGTDELARAVERFAAIGFSSTPSFSPAGDRMAFVSDRSGTPQVWLSGVPGGAPERVTSFDDQVTNAVWSPAEDMIAVEVAPGGGLNQQIYLVRADGSDTRRITPGGAENNRLGPWARDGRHVFLSSSRDEPARLDVFRVDLGTGEWDLVARTPGVGIATDVSRNGRWILVTRTFQRGNSDVYQVDLTNGTEIHLTHHKGQAQHWGAQFDRHGVVWMGGNVFGDTHALYRVTVHRGRTATFSQVRWRQDAELEDLKINQAGTLAVLIWNVRGVNELELFDVESEVRARHGLARGSLGATVLPAEVAGGPAWSPDGRRIALVTSGSTSPVDIWAFEITGDPLNPRLAREGTRLTHSPHEGVDLQRLVRPHLVRFTAHDGLEITGWLYVPESFEAPGPCVISFHGGPEAQERPIFNRTYQGLLAHGIAVFAPNVRGSAGFGKKFVHLDDLEKRFDGVRDIESCVRHVVGIGVADAKRVGITGASYGGFMTMAGITEFPELFAAAVCVCGIVNFLTFFEHTQPWMAVISKTEYGDPETQADLLRALSPINKLHRARTPTLVLHGANDTNVPLIEAEQIVDELRRRGVEVASVIFPDEGHGFTKIVNRTRAAVETVRWFVTHL
jgi:dipeptidyl aminopeptidase/acylaminoacyl peptidase